MANNRDIMEMRGAIEPRLLTILLNFNNDIHALRQNISTVANTINQLANVMSQQQIVMEHFKPYIERLKAMGMAVGSDPSITGQVDEED